jgi:predicted metal-dependent hydrolase
MNNDSINKIEITRSFKRKKTISAHLKNGVLSVQAPASVPDEELDKIVSKLKKRLVNKKLKKELNRNGDLREIAETLNKEYFSGKLKINSIDYSTNQDSLFGYCNYRTGKILISHRLAKMPDWVRNYVIIHELAHLVVPNHSRAFQELTEKYKLKERAIGYLMAKGLQEEESDNSGFWDNGQ